jgi:hypothetical protein
MLRTWTGLLINHSSTLIPKGRNILMSSKTANIISFIFLFLGLLTAFGKGFIWNMVSGMFGGVQPSWWSMGLSILSLVFIAIAIILTWWARKKA